MYRGYHSAVFLGEKHCSATRAEGECRSVVLSQVHGFCILDWSFFFNTFGGATRDRTRPVYISLNEKIEKRDSWNRKLIPQDSVSISSPTCPVSAAFAQPFVPPSRHTTFLQLDHLRLRGPIFCRFLGRNLERWISGVVAWRIGVQYVFNNLK